MVAGLALVWAFLAVLLRQSSSRTLHEPRAAVAGDIAADFSTGVTTARIGRVENFITDVNSCVYWNC